MLNHVNIKENMWTQYTGNSSEDIWYIIRNDKNYYGIVVYKDQSIQYFITTDFIPNDKGEYNLISCKGLSKNYEFVDFDIKSLKLFQSLLEAKNEVAKLIGDHKCTCDIMVLMSSGCQCGSI